MFRYIFLLIICGTIGYGGWYAFEHYDELSTHIPGMQKEGSILTFELGTTAEELMQKHGKELLKDDQHTFGKVTVKFLPFVLFDVKYTTADKKTEEAKLLFSLENGEMVLDTRTFDTTHGFEDCINAKAQDDDFRLMHALAKSGGTLSKEALCQDLGIDSELVLERVEALRKKHLIAIHGDTVRIHLSSPVLKVQPETKVSHHFMTKTVQTESQIPTRYSKDQVRKVTKAAFGTDFAIRREELIFVPIFQIDIQNPDGSTRHTYWNGCTGRRIELRRF
jgi:hypothetical protein